MVLLKFWEEKMKICENEWYEMEQNVSKGGIILIAKYNPFFGPRLINIDIVPFFSENLVTCLKIRLSELFPPVSYNSDRLCGLVVRVSGYRYRGPGFDLRRYQIF